VGIVFVLVCLYVFVCLNASSCVCMRSFCMLEEAVGECTAKVSLFLLFSSLTLPISAFHLSMLSEVSLTSKFPSMKWCCMNAMK
jgi:hypothetical protein